MQTLFLVRGLPGSGKTTFGATICENVFAADDYFMEDGIYKFDPSKLGEAHAECLRVTKEALACGESVAVCNTFTQRWELQPYLEREQGDYQVFVIDLFDGGYPDEVLASRNAHGVPVEAIAAMRARYEHDWKNGSLIPPWLR
jgi:hypothetical protein